MFDSEDSLEQQSLIKKITRNAKNRHFSEIKSEEALAETMAMEAISRALRDGALEGEYPPALTVKDSIEAPLGQFVFNHILTQLFSNVSSAKSQSQGIVLVALDTNPSFYIQQLTSKGGDFASSRKWLRVLDCHTDPLGWKSRLVSSGMISDDGTQTSTSLGSSLCRNVKDLDIVFSSIIELGSEMIGGTKGRFAVAIDSLSELSRHTTVSSTAALLNSLRTHDQVSCVFWLLHADLHEKKTIAAFEYMSSMAATIEPITGPLSGHRVNPENLQLAEQNFSSGKFHVRFKRRNGRVRMMSENLHVGQTGIRFMPPSEDELSAQSLIPKVQFNLQLTEKERKEREKVVLPYEHQGNGETIQIYDGRKSLNESEIEHKQASTEEVQTKSGSGVGEIIYFRDSDDEMPDSDEDPDDDLDI